MEVLNFDIKNYVEYDYTIVAIVKCTKKTANERYFNIGSCYPVIRKGGAYFVVDEDMDADYTYVGYETKKGLDYTIKAICENEWFKFEPVEIRYVDGLEVGLAPAYEVELI